MIFSAFLRILNPAFMPCFAVRWSSMILMNTLGTFSMFQGWDKSDRGMRNKFHWTTKPKFLVAANITTFVYSCLVLCLLDKFGNSLSKHNGCECYFLLPWVAHTPYFIFCVAVNLWTNFLTKKSATEESTTDSFGIHSERTVENLTMGPLLALQIVFAQLCFEDKISKYHSVSNFLYILPPFSHAMINVVSPAIRALTGFYKKGPKKTQRLTRYRIQRKSKVIKVGCAAITVGDQPLSTQNIVRNKSGLVLDILQNEEQAALFKTHAKKNFCGESVDFCREVSQYKQVHVENSDKTHLYQKFLTIIEEFVVNNAPCEVNISSSQKAHILQYKNESVFECAEVAAIINVFDNARVEVAKMLADNLLSSFVLAINATTIK